jgi:hypothetical protein
MAQHESGPAGSEEWAPERAPLPPGGAPEPCHTPGLLAPAAAGAAQLATPHTHATSSSLEEGGGGASSAADADWAQSAAPVRAPRIAEPLHTAHLGPSQRASRGIWQRATAPRRAPHCRASRGLASVLPVGAGGGAFGARAGAARRAAAEGAGNPAFVSRFARRQFQAQRAPPPPLPPPAGA